MKRALIPLALLTLNATAADQPPHGVWTDAKVTGVTLYTTGGPSGRGFLIATLSVNATGSPPTCASGYPRNVAVDVTTESGKFAGATIQQAMTTGAMLGSTITVNGTGSCTIVANTETLASIQTQSPHMPGAQ